MSLFVFWETSFWFNPRLKIWKILLFLFPLFERFFLRRYNHFLRDCHISYNYFGMFLFFFGRFIFLTERRNFIEDVWHDFWCSFKINRIRPSFFFGYEKSCLSSFMHVKNIGGVTILDLAQVHVSLIEDLRKRYNFFSNLSGDKNLFNHVKSRKIKEYSLADYIIVPSNFAKDTLTASGIDENKISVFNLGFSQKYFYPKSSYSLSQTSILKVIFVGIITKRKGVHIISKAAYELRDLSIEWIFVGSIDDGFESVESIGNKKYHSYSEHQDLLKEFHSADLFVLPSYLDSWGMVVIEAMACGLPVIVSENTGAKDAVTNDCGFVIPIDDADSLVDKVLYFYNNRTEIERMGRNASKQAQNYTWDNYYRQINDFIGAIS